MPKLRGIINKFTSEYGGKPQFFFNRNRHEVAITIFRFIKEIAIHGQGAWGIHESQACVKQVIYAHGDTTIEIGSLIRFLLLNGVLTIHQRNLLIDMVEKGNNLGAFLMFFCEMLPNKKDSKECLQDAILFANSLAHWYGINDEELSKSREPETRKKQLINKLREDLLKVFKIDNRLNIRNFICELILFRALHIQQLEYILNVELQECPNSIKIEKQVERLIDVLQDKFVGISEMVASHLQGFIKKFAADTVTNHTTSQLIRELADEIKGTLESSSKICYNKKWCGLTYSFINVICNNIDVREACKAKFKEVELLSRRLIGIFKGYETSVLMKNCEAGLAIVLFFKVFQHTDIEIQKNFVNILQTLATDPDCFPCPEKVARRLSVKRI